MIEEHVDVLIVGAGLSGIGAACHLQSRCPGKNYTILEARGKIGGTWDLFRYPGIRSDSDMYTMGYSFKPWRQAKAIADGPSILEYVRETAREHGVERRIRFNHRVTRVEFEGAEARWMVEAVRTDTGATVRISSGFLFMCTGYYRYEEPYTPEFPGVERFAGPIVHPQHWTDQIDYAGKRVVVIGSGATAVTLVPELARTAQHVTMLQRSPTYMISLPSEDALANSLRRLLGARAAYPIVRWKNVLFMLLVFQLSRRRPGMVRAWLRRSVQRRLPAGYDVDMHFNPRYDPWDQRLCLVPDGDLFCAVADGRASVVTDRIESFTETGLRLSSGVELQADLIVTATGLSLLALGGVRLAVDGREVDVSETVIYRGTMLSGVPNMAFTLGYTNASWTLKADLASEYVCRLLAHMDQRGYRQCTPCNSDPSIATQPFFDFSSGYVQRAIAQFPKQGSRAPWRLRQNYLLDTINLRHGAIEDGTMRFSHAEPMRGSAEARASVAERVRALR